MTNWISLIGENDIMFGQLAKQMKSYGLSQNKSLEMAKTLTETLMSDASLEDMYDKFAFDYYLSKPLKNTPYNIKDIKDLVKGVKTGYKQLHFYVDVEIRTENSVHIDMILDEPLDYDGAYNLAIIYGGMLETRFRRTLGLTELHYYIGDTNGNYKQL